MVQAKFMRHNMPILHYAKSLIWNGLRQHLQVVDVNTSWQLGDGSKINFCHDKWFSLPVVDLINFSADTQLSARVSDFI